MAVYLSKMAATMTGTRISLYNGGKLEESEGPNCFLHHFLCVRIE